MCECIKTINEQLAEQNRNTVIDVPLQLSKDMQLGPPKTIVGTAKADANVRKRPVTVFASYCPFCGEKCAA